MLNLNDMILFAKVAEYKGISPAARALGLPKSKVSRRVAALEQDLGAGLLERTTRAVELTEMGEVFYQHCARVAEEADSAVASIGHLQDTPRGLLRVSVSISIGQYLVAPYLGEFALQYPEIDLQLDLTNRRVDLITEGYDLVIRVGQLQDSNLMSRRIGNARAHVVASPEYIAENGSPNHPNQLKDHTLLAMGHSNFTSQWVLENTAGDTKATEVHPKHSVNDFQTLANMAIGGAGIVITPEYVTRAAVNDKKLIRVLPDWRSPMMSYYVLYPSKRGLTKKAEAWIEFFSEKFKEASRP